MASPTFEVVVIVPSAGAAFLTDSMKKFVRTRVVDELNRVCGKSSHATVRAGFSLRFVDDDATVAKEVWDKVPKTTFRVYLIPKKVDLPAIVNRAKKLAPGLDHASLEKQLKLEGGAGARGSGGESIAFVRTLRIEDLVLMRPTAAQVERIGSQLGGLIAHELGHAMGIKKNGKGLMLPKFDVDSDENTPIQTAKFDSGDEKTVRDTLESVAP